MDYSHKEDIIEITFEGIKNLILPSASNDYRSKFLQSNMLLYCVVLLVVLKVSTTLVSINFPQNIFFADITKASLENFVNQTRQSIGLKPLSENKKLNQAAQLKAENMVQNNYFDHTSPSGVSPWFWFLKAGYGYKYAGENLAIGFYESQEVYDAWLNSPSHKANIVNPNYTEVGTAVMSGFGQNNTIVVVQEFASPKIVVSENSTTKTQVTVKPKENPVPKIAEPTPTSSTQSEEPSTGEKVLSQVTESQNYLESTNLKIENNLYSRFMNLVMYSYDRFLQGVIYGVSLIIIGILITLIFLNFDINFKKALVFRAVLIIVLLSVATLVDKETIVALIPHQVII